MWIIDKTFRRSGSCVSRKETPPRGTIVRDPVSRPSDAARERSDHERALASFAEAELLFGQVDLLIRDAVAIGMNVRRGAEFRDKGLSVFAAAKKALDAGCPEEAVSCVRRARSYGAMAKEGIEYSLARYRRIIQACARLYSRWFDLWPAIIQACAAGKELRAASGRQGWNSLRLLDIAAMEGSERFVNRLVEAVSKLFRGEETAAERESERAEARLEQIKLFVGVFSLFARFLSSGECADRAKLACELGEAVRRAFGDDATQKTEREFDRARSRYAEAGGRDGESLAEAGAHALKAISLIEENIAERLFARTRNRSRPSFDDWTVKRFASDEYRRQLEADLRFEIAARFPAPLTMRERLGEDTAFCSDGPCVCCH